MQNFDRSQVTTWLNTAPPTEVVAVGKQILSKIATLPAEQRDQFTREISSDQNIAKLFTAHA